MNRSEVRKILRQTMANEVTWPDSALNTWIGEALLDYGNYFPKHTTEDITTTTAREYEFTATNVLGVLKVEYPQGESPPRWLGRLAETSPIFYEGTFYDLRGEPPTTLVIGEMPTAGETIRAYLAITRSLPASDTEELDIPERHTELVKLYVQWQAIKALELDESRDADDTSLLLSLFGLNAVRAERVYRSKIEDFSAVESPAGYAGPWAMDEWGRGPASGRVY